MPQTILYFGRVAQSIKMAVYEHEQRGVTLFLPCCEMAPAEQVDHIT
jgi:hypothetical protein